MTEQIIQFVREIAMTIVLALFIAGICITFANR
jgi:hypothetical protein